MIMLITCYLLLLQSRLGPGARWRPWGPGWPRWMAELGAGVAKPGGLDGYWVALDGVGWLRSLRLPEIHGRVQAVEHR